MRSAVVSFPPVALDPGEDAAVEVPATLHPQRLAMVGLMDETRGHFRIKRSRLPLLDADDVVAYSTYRRTPWRRRTVVEHLVEKTATPKFRRTYLPSSVTYVPKDPLDYVEVLQLECDRTPTMPSTVGVPATVFRPEVLGLGLALPRAKHAVRLTLRNRGDVQVRVYATVFGRSP